MAEWQQRLDLNLGSFVLPAALSSILSIAAGIVLISLRDPTNSLLLPASLKALIGPVDASIIAGFVGAFVWGVYDFVDRFRILNLSPAALHMTWFRLVLGPVLGYYIQFVAKDNLAPFMAFAVATLPVPDVAAWIRDKARSALSITASRSADPRWDLLQGLTADMVPRLVEADVSSVAHLANQDPINLLRRTSVEWRNVLDMMDQAYLCTYVDDKLPKLRVRGIRGAIEMAVLHGRLHSDNPDKKSEAEEVVTSLVGDLQSDEASVKNLARNLYDDPQVDLIWTLWYDRDESMGGSVTAPATAEATEPSVSSQDGDSKSTAASAPG